MSHQNQVWYSTTLKKLPVGIPKMILTNKQIKRQRKTNKHIWVIQQYSTKSSQIFHKTLWKTSCVKFLDLLKASSKGGQRVLLGGQRPPALCKSQKEAPVSHKPNLQVAINLIKYQVDKHSIIRTTKTTMIRL